MTRFTSNSDDFLSLNLTITLDKHYEFDTVLLNTASKSCDWADKKSLATFVAFVSFYLPLAILKDSEMADSLFCDIIRTAYEENRIYVGRKQALLYGMYFSDLSSVVVQYRVLLF